MLGSWEGSKLAPITGYKLEGRLLVRTPLARRGVGPPSYCPPRLDAGVVVAKPEREKIHNAEVCFKTALCNSSAAGAVTRKVVATEMKPPQTPLSLTGKDGSFMAPPLCLARRGVPAAAGGERRVRSGPRTMCCPLVLSRTGGLTRKPGGSLCGDSVIARELSGEAVSSATALTVRSALCLESFWL